MVQIANHKIVKEPPIDKMSSSSEYTVPCRGIVAYTQHDWKLEDLLTREPKEDEFLIDLIATGVCHTDISGYGGIYPRVLGHEGKQQYLIKTVNMSYSNQYTDGERYTQVPVV